MLSNTLALSSLIGLGSASYVLQQDYLANGNFFEQFTFYTGSDPTHGTVDYLDQADAQSAGLISASSTNVRIAADSTNVTPNGRPSVRISSNAAYNSGLIILDLEHMPAGACGTWPAFWMLGPNWPNDGEVDIIEGVNQGTTNLMSMHTREGCTITNNNNFTGTITNSDCWVDDPNQSSNSGCSISTTNTNTYGSQFNSNGGGVYATDFDSSAISIWFFPRGSIPSDITSGNPTMSGWGEPIAQFQGGCNIDSFIYDQSLVFDLTFCGDWAGNVWSSSSCASLATTCASYVENTPSAFTNSYWSINSLKVYEQSTAAASSSSSSSKSSTTSTSSTSTTTKSTTAARAVSAKTSTTSTTTARRVVSTSSVRRRHIRDMHVAQPTAEI